MNYNKILAAGFLILGMVVLSCQNRSKTTDLKGNNTESNEQVQVKILRLDKDLFALNIDSVTEGIPALKAKYNEIFELYSFKVIELGSPSAPDFPEFLRKFIADYYVNLFNNKVEQLYPTLEPVENQFTEAFQKYKEYFPDKRIPTVFSYISGGNFSVVTADTILGIGLDKYLGRNCEYYERMGLDKYKRHTMQSEYIVPDALRTWGYTEFEFSDSSSNVLSNMLYEAKILYFVKQLLPNVQDSIIMGFSNDQLTWCKSNESRMWNTLAERKLLFSTDYLTIRKLVYPAPFTYYFTNESPGRAAVWIGYQIIHSFMSKNEDVSLPELMAITDYHKLLRNSGYKPE